MNKRQEALRRGLRSFIADALHELEALQERPAAPGEPRAEAHRDAAATDLIITDRDPVPDSRPRLPAGAAQPTPKASRPAPRRIPRRESEEAPAAAAAAAGAQPPAVPDPWQTPGTAAAIEVTPLAAPRIIVPGWRDPRHEVPSIVVPDGCRSDDHEERPPAAGRSPEAPRVEESPSPPVEEPHPMSPSVPVATGVPETAPGPGRARTRSRRRDRSAGRKRPAPRYRTESGLAANGAGVEHAYGRKGVCFAYFINAECWRVPEAYCNSALQVCITRECPVYQLHREQLEQRFAKKFKHFW